MLRILVLGFAASGVFLSEHTTKDYASVVNQPIDPMITGHSISEAHKRQWAINSQKYKECGLCGETMQAYPQQ